MRPRHALALAVAVGRLIRPARGRHPRWRCLARAPPQRVQGPTPSRMVGAHRTSNVSRHPIPILEIKHT